MRDVDLVQELAKFRSVFLADILCSKACKSKSASLAGVGQVVKAGRKISIPDKPTSSRTGKVRQRDCGPASIGSIDKGEG